MTTLILTAILIGFCSGLWLFVHDRLAECDE